LLCVLVPTYLTSRSRAQEEPVLVSFEACERSEASLDVPAVLELARAELGGALVQLQTPLHGELAVRQDCQTGELELSRFGSGSPPQHISLKDVATELRTRVVALALAESALDRARELEINSDGKLPPARRRAKPLTLDPELKTLKETKAPPLSRTWTVGPELRAFFQLPVLSGGGRTSVLSGRMEWSAFLHYQRQRHELGTVSVGAFGLGWAGVLMQSEERGHTALSIGGELGATWAKGQPNSSVGGADYALRPWVSGMLWLSLDWIMHARTHAVARLLLGAGYAMGIEAQVDGRTVASSAGPTATLALTFGTRR
jgi:hypothetical protein